MMQFFEFKKIPIQTTADQYLRTNLLQLVEEIEQKPTDSDTLSCLGMGHISSTNSLVIQMGYVFEHFWNKVITDCSTSLITSADDMINIGNDKRQMDMLFVKNHTVYYLECKSNVNFDSEKTKASDQKVRQITEAVVEQYNDHKIVSGYFMPNCREILKKYRTKYTNRGLNIFGVNWLHETLQCDIFTVDEYFTFLRDVVGPICKQKCKIFVYSKYITL